MELTTLSSKKAAQDHGLLFKVILMGGSKVGKSNLLSRLAYNKFTLGSQATVGIEFAPVALVHGNRIFRLEVWDVEGASPGDVQQSYYQNSIGRLLSPGVLLVVDLTRKESLEEARAALRELRKRLNSHAAVLLLANKKDLSFLRDVSRAELSEFASQHSLPLREVSAYSGEGVREAAEQLVSQVSQLIVNSLGFIPLDSASRELRSGQRPLTGKL